MALIRKLKSLLGIDETENESRDVGVTVEHDPTTEADVKGIDLEETTAEVIAPTADEAEPASDEAAGEPIEEAEPHASTEAIETEEPEADTAAAEPTEAPIERAEPETAAEEPEPEAPTDEVEADEVLDESIEEAEPEAPTDEPAIGDAAATGEPIDSIKGIGPAYADRLGEAGVESVSDLAEVDAEELAEETDIAPARIEKWIGRAGRW